MQDQSFWDIWTPRVLSVVRIVIALLFIEHGTQKLVGFPPGGPGPVPMGSMLGAAALIEILGGTLLFFGLFTRFAAFIMCGEMAVAYFTVHAPRGPFPVVNQGEPAILFCFLFLFFVFSGAGSWSLDALIWKKPMPKTMPTQWNGPRPVRT